MAAEGLEDIITAGTHAEAGTRLSSSHKSCSQALLTHSSPKIAQKVIEQWL